MSGRKRNGPRAVAAARKARIVASAKPTQLHYSKPLPDPSAGARAPDDAGGKQAAEPQSRAA